MGHGRLLPAEFIALLFLTTVCLLLPGSSRAGSAINYAGHCDIVFFGTSTLKNFSGNVTSRLFRMTAADLNDISQALQVRVEVEIKKMDTGSNLMNSHMYKMFETEKYPLISGVIADTPAVRAAAKKGVTAGDAVSLMLTFHGRTNAVDVYIENIHQEGAATVITGASDLLLTDFGIEPPKFLFFFKVHDRVRLHGDVVLYPETATEDNQLYCP